MSSNINKFLHKVADGRFTLAIKVFGSSGVSPYNAYTLKSLEAKLPYKSPPSMVGYGQVMLRLVRIWNDILMTSNLGSGYQMMLRLFCTVPTDC